MVFGGVWCFNGLSLIFSFVVSFVFSVVFFGFVASQCVPRWSLFLLGGGAKQDFDGFYPGFA